MKKLTSILLIFGATLTGFGAQNGVSYNTSTKDVSQTDLDFTMSSLSVSNAIVAINNWVQLSGQTNRLTIAGGVLLLDGSPIGGGGATYWTLSSAGVLVSTNLSAIASGIITLGMDGERSGTNNFQIATNGSVVIGYNSTAQWGGLSGTLLDYRDTTKGESQNFGIVMGAAPTDFSTFGEIDIYGSATSATYKGTGKGNDGFAQGYFVIDGEDFDNSRLILNDTVTGRGLSINPLRASGSTAPYNLQTLNDFGADKTHVFKNAGTETAKLTGLGFFSALKSLASYDLNFNAYPEQPDGSSAAYALNVKTAWTSTNYTHTFKNGTTNMIGVTADNKLTFKDVNYLQPSGEYLTLNSDASTLFSLLEFRNEANPNIAASVGTSPSGAWIQSTEPQVDFTYGTNSLALFPDGIRTNPPNEGTNSQAFKIGVPAGSVGLTLISTQYIQISLDGVAYKLAIVKE